MYARKIISSLALAFLALINATNGDLFTATTHLKVMSTAEEILIQNLKNYIFEEKSRIEYLEEKLKLYEENHKKVEEDAGAYFGNPIKAFLITKRLTSDWAELLIAIKYNTSDEILRNVSYYRENIQFPTSEDLNGAAVAMIRLQKTYNLKTADAAKGILNGVQYNTKMTTSDCFQLGREAYAAAEYRYSIYWMNEALKRHQQNPDEFIEISENMIYGFLHLAYKLLENYSGAIEMASKLLKDDPENVQLKESIEEYEKKIKSGHIDTPVDEDIDEPDIKPEINPYYVSFEEKTRYDKLCRNEIKRSPAMTKNLKCKYVTNKSKFLTIGPLKLEEMSLDPYIVVYHQVLFQSEIDLIKRLASPMMERAVVTYADTTSRNISNERISKSAWLTDADDYRIRAIDLRVEDMTQLTTETSEMLQVVNYGIGGQYEPHFDFAQPRDNTTFSLLGTGNRIATNLFYMSDVEQGGATVFPYIDLALFPKKGSAALWYNLFYSGGPDFRTKHGSCPVLVGSKWICNKWLHEMKQEFLRPCFTTKDHPPLEYYID